ncbi:MAG: carbamoyl-phosphate synthase large subunit [Methanomassiliicoccaceae archaeon]|jgi:carbamoyl-phosphate synthase large subunit|nr:carbamoyl-phosphate synthase large subunit [Methanomassiliicoccaceae archaeon]HQA20271.1 carbamoyl-phosphate synthase large subunit [Methanomassiliicoccaceae archaeon]HQD87300.1 carbamoyl-phosphate synthase large subunit [Methanomassiliicoccaceae archaeon]
MKRTDLKKIMVIGSGPIVIGQAAEFDFSGSQACRSLREEGYQTVLVNSNPATIQTDVETADIVYVEPLTAETVARIAEKEKVDGILSGMGGQTALNICSELAENGTLGRLGIELLGTQPEAIALSEDRELFREMMLRIGEPIPKSKTVHSVEEAKEAAREIGRYPVLVRPAYTLGGTGGGIAHNEEELEVIAGRGLAYSRIHQVLIEESVLGWKEFEYEVMRDGKDNCIIVCSMENLDPMGIHTGESIVIAPAQTLSDEDHQRLRNASIKTIRALGIEGGCNIQFAFDPVSREYRVIEVNPRVSRSSALASKATGYPIARVGAKIALGYTLDEIPNNITGKTFAALEPTIDYVVLKVPRWPFDKFRTVDRILGTQMKSTGEVMAIGRTVEEGLLKAIRSLEIEQEYLDPLDWSDDRIMEELTNATDQRIFAIAEALRRGMSVEAIADITKWDTYFIHKIRNIIEMEKALRSSDLDDVLLRRAKRMGFSDDVIARLTGSTEEDVRRRRKAAGIVPTYKMVDTCAAEFSAETPYFYSTYESDNDASPSNRRKVVIVGGGPIRIGQGIEFDYACVHGVLALQEEGVEAIIVNNNPETVSTDYDISDRLYFEPLTFEDVLNVVENEDADGVILQFGGQTAINLAMPLMKALEGKRAKVLGTSPEDVDVAEDRKLFSALMDRLGIPQPKSGTGHSFEEVREIANRIGYPVLVRPSYVIGGRAMEIVYSEEELRTYVETAVKVSKTHPILVDKYLSHAIEVDVDAVSDGQDVFIGGMLDHIEEAGVHSGDATMTLPPQTLSPEIIAKIVEITEKVARALRIKGLLNLQLAVKDGEVYMIEANPRASRTVPFVSKAIGVPLAKVATKVILGKSLKELGLTGVASFNHVAVKASVFPFLKLPGVDSILGPEMRSTGEVMGIDKDFASAMYKALISAGMKLPSEGGVYITVNDADKPEILDVARQLSRMGFHIYATRGTSTYLREHGLQTTTVYTISQKMDPDALGLMRRGKINLIINTPTNSSGARRDGYMMRRLAVELEIPFLTTVQAARATVSAMRKAAAGRLEVMDLATHHRAASLERPQC